MTRDLARLERAQFDALVIGAGIYGLALAWELTSRGAAVAIVDRGDFGSGTTSNSLKTLHGGIRSLQHGALGEMRRFVRERRALATIAPHLVRPLGFAIPTTRRLVHHKAALGAFLTLYDLLTGDRNAHVQPSLQLPSSRILSRDEALDVNPLVDRRDVTGGALWYDYQMRNSERLALAFLQSSVDSGACAANYAEATSLLRDGNRITGATIRDSVSGATIDVRARATINAAGPWAWTLLDRAGVTARIDRGGFSKAMNLVVRRVTGAHAVGGVARGRFVFVVPWREYSIAGTSHHPFEGAAETLDLQSTEVRDFLDEVRTAFPGAGLSEHDIRLVHRGLLPARPRGVPGHGDLLKDTIVHAHQDDGTPGLFTVVGVRYTTARETRRAGRRPDPANHPRTDRPEPHDLDAARRRRRRRHRVVRARRRPRGAGVRTRPDRPARRPLRIELRCGADAPARRSATRRAARWAMSGDGRRDCPRRPRRNGAPSFRRRPAPHRRGVGRAPGPRRAGAGRGRHGAASRLDRARRSPDEIADVERHFHVPL